MNGLWNGTNLTYVSLPLTARVRETLATISSIIAVLCILSNGTVLYFQRTQRSPSTKGLQVFRRPLNGYFVQSMALSDITASLKGIILHVCQLLANIFLNDWICRAVRFSQFAFPSITICNLVAVSVERYLGIFYPFRVPSDQAVRRSIIGAWMVEFAVTFFPSATYHLMPVKTSEQYYHILCRYNNNHPVFRAMLFCYAGIVFFIPCIGLFVVAIRITRHMQKRTFCNFDSLRFKGYKMFVSLVFAFVFPYMNFFLYTIVTMTVKPNFSFDVDFFLRYTGTTVAFANGLINPIIYFYYNTAYRTRLKRALCLYSRQKSRRIGPKVEPTVQPTVQTTVQPTV
ncbi:adenosine receptor A3 [Nematostella vectensis]|uniref:adenosine receptor A3 n=1 Tax=Nematostella vectensis TaxID=45351 RepID=UPI0020776943|nr:adenosine receptor A3 [Nematostella vectensis]